MLGRFVLEITAAPATGYLSLPLVGEGLEPAATHTFLLYIFPKKFTRLGSYQAWEWLSDYKLYPFACTCVGHCMHTRFRLP